VALWDGGLVANNPGLAAVGEVLRLDLAERNTPLRAGPGQAPDVRVLSLGTGYRDAALDAGDWGPAQSARRVVAALVDASVGSAAFLLRQPLGERAVRVSPPVANYAIDDPSAVATLDDAANAFFDRDRRAVRQPDGAAVDLADWLAKFWFD